ncbi:MAG: LD-carboxypeptidase [Bacteroidetes bacterium]|nr:LD-carboxypeptidase [Bacteroidota bacterium]
MSNFNRRKFLRNAALASAAMLTSKANAEPMKLLRMDTSAILPPRLKKGDTIALTAPAGAIFVEDSIDKATTALEGAGFKVKHCPTLYQKYGYLAGPDDFRAKELNELFADTSVQGIVAMRGGWGCARLLNLLDYDVIRKNPKVFSGFSDITTLLLAIYARTGMITFHGPVGNSSWGDFTLNNFLSIVVEGEALLMQQPKEDPLTVHSPGTATGILLGGNLSVLCSNIGTGYLPDLNSALLFLEETEEEPYQIDRMLTQLSIAGTLMRAKGIIFGKCTKCDAEEPEKSFTTDEVLREKFADFLSPVVQNFSFGHVKDKFTFPVGAIATLDTVNSSVQLEHVCVK